MSSSTSSRAEGLPTAHGEIPLPAFLPDATRGVVRAVDAQDLRGAGIRALMANAFHLARRPGVRTVEHLGGLHRFAGWEGPIVTDSGGFQILSMIRENAKLGTVRDDHVVFRDPDRGRRTVLTPEKSITTQLRLGADVLVALDDCPAVDAPVAEVERSVERTVSWFRRSREALDRHPRRGEVPLVAVVHGGASEALRRRCAQELAALGATAFGFGGWPIDAEGRFRAGAFAAVAETVPAKAPLFALGVGKPEHLVTAVGIRRNLLFDCSLPTRDARHWRLYRFRDAPERLDLADGKDFYETLYVQDAHHARAREPVSPVCDCHCCAGYTLGYLHHLFRVKDALALRLATIHNLRFYARLVEALRGGAEDPT